MKILTLSFALLSIAGVCQLAGADTQLTEPWVDHAYVNSHGPVASILVIGVTELPETRRQLENSLAKALANDGVNATASLDLMSEDTEVNKENVLAAVAGKNIDAVLLTRLFRTEDVQIVQGGDPGTIRTERDFAIQLWENYEGTRDQALNAPKSKKHRIVLENNLYDIDTEDLVWTVQSLSMDAKSADKVIKSLSKLIPKSLRDAYLI